MTILGLAGVTILRKRGIDKMNYHTVCSWENTYLDAKGS